MFDTMAGIDSDGPGFKKIIIRPRPDSEVSWVKASYDSIRGKISASWRREAGAFHLETTIPANTTATVYLPANNKLADVTESGLPADQAPGVRFLRQQDGTAVFELGSGTYVFISKE